MRKLLLAVAVLFVAASVQAQETYSVTLGGSTTNRNSLVGQVELGRTQHNTDVCRRSTPPLADTCTQAQACVALGVEGGASCTAANALAAEARIYAGTLAGREAFVTNELIRFRVSIYLLEQITREAAVYKTWCQSANQTSLNVVCAAAGLPNGCYPCGQ